MAPANPLTNTQAQMRKGILEFCTLLAIARKPMYSSDILAALKKADLIVVEGTLYPLLSRMKKAGLLEYDWKESKSGPPRKYYSLTAEGKQALKTLQATWDNLSSSISQLLKTL